MRYIVAVIVFCLPLLLLTGCQNPDNSPEVNAILRVTQACGVYDTTLRTLAVARANGHLNESQVATVDRWRPILNGICMGPVPEVAADSLLDTIEKALLELNSIQGGQ